MLRGLGIRAAPAGRLWSVAPALAGGLWSCAASFPQTTHPHLSDLEAIEWIYKVPQAILLLCNLVFLVWIMAVSWSTEAVSLCTMCRMNVKSTLITTRVRDGDDGNRRTLPYQRILALGFGSFVMKPCRLCQPAHGPKARALPSFPLVH